MLTEFQTFDKVNIMSKLLSTKASAILVGLSLFAASLTPAFAAPESIRTTVDPATRTEKLASRAAALKTRLQTFKDKRKAEIAERVSANLNALNQNQIAQMQKHLGNMSAILDKLENRINQPNTKAAIVSARANIASSSAAVTAQSLKDYTIQVTSETKIKADAKLQRDKLHTDLQTLRKMVIDVKQSVANSIRIAKSGSEIKEATSSGQ